MTATFRNISYAEDVVGGSSIVVPVPSGVVNGDQMFMFAIFPFAGTPGTPAGWTSMGFNAARYAVFKRVASSEPASYTFSLSAGGPWTYAAVYIAAYQNWGSDGLDSVASQQQNAYDTYTRATWSTNQAFDMASQNYKRNCPYFFVTFNYRGDMTDPTLTAPAWTTQRASHIATNGASKLLTKVHDVLPKHWSNGEPSGVFIGGTGDGSGSNFQTIFNQETNSVPAPGTFPPAPLHPDRVKFKRRMKFEHLPYDLTRTMTREL